MDGIGRLGHEGLLHTNGMVSSSPIVPRGPSPFHPTIKLPNTVPDPFVQEVAGRHEPLVFVGLGPVPLCALGPEPFVPSGLPVVVGHQPVHEVLLCLDPAQRDGDAP